METNAEECVMTEMTERQEDSRIRTDCTGCEWAGLRMKAHMVAGQ